MASGQRASCPASADHYCVVAGPSDRLWTLAAVVLGLLVVTVLLVQNNSLPRSLSRSCHCKPCPAESPGPSADPPKAARSQPAVGRDRPNVIPSARQCQPVSASPSISKIIFQTVKDRNALSDIQKQSVQSFKDKNPGYEHRLFEDADMDNFFRNDCPELWPMWQKLERKVDRADVWRSAVVYKFGGYYSDSDTICVRPIDQWIPPAEMKQPSVGLVAGLESLVGQVYAPEIIGLAPTVHIVQSTFGARPGHPLLRRMLWMMQEYVELEAAGEIPQLQVNRDLIWRTGPGVFTDAVIQHLRLVFHVSELHMKSHTGIPHWYGDIVLLPIPAFNPSADHMADVAKHGVLVQHKFAGSWVHEKGGMLSGHVDDSRIYPPLPPPQAINQAWSDQSRNFPA